MILQTIVNWLLMLVGILGVLGFAIAGVMYLVSAGNEDMIKKAKSAMVWSIVGIAVALLGLVVILTIDALLSGDPTGGE